MGQSDLMELYNEKIQIIYPIIGLNGQVGMLFQRSPYVGLADVEFSPGGVSVRTLDFDDKMEVIVKVYKGIPDTDSLISCTCTATGIIAIGEKGLELSAGISTEAIFPWASGLTDVLVVLDINEVLTRQVRTITFYAEPYKVRVKKKFLNLFLWPEKD